METAGNANRPAQRGVRRERAVSVDRIYIAPGGTATPTVAITLFDDNQILVDVERVEVRGPDNYTWFGRVRDYDRSDVVLSVVDGVLAGGIGLASSASGQAAQYRLQPAGAGSLYLQELDSAQMPPDHPPGWTGEPPPGLLNAPLQQPAASPPQADSGAQVDIMVVYSDETAAAAGSGIGAEIQYAIDRANLAYANSGITTQLRLVAWGAAGYSESGDFNTDLTRLATTGDGYMNGVDTARNTYAADVVALLIENPAYCGIGYLNATATTAFVVVNRGCAGGYLSLAHEVGHNFGARHDPYVDAAVTPYAYGHGYVNLAGQWRTVLAYDNQCNDNGFSCTRIPYISTPLFSYLGSPVGTAATHDNARVHNNRAVTMANFRTTIVVAAPTVTTGAASAIAGSNATLNGTVTSNGASTTVSFEYGTTVAYGNSITAGGSPLAAGSSGQAVSATLNGLSGCTLYHFRVVGTNSAGTTYGGDNAFHSAGCPTAPSVTINAPTAITTAGATFNAIVSSNGASTSVTFQYGLTTGYGNIVTAAQNPLAASATNASVSATVTDLNCSTTYHVRAVATNSVNAIPSADAAFTTSACGTGGLPPTVAVDSASNVTATSAMLSGTILSNDSPATVAFFYGFTASYGGVVTPAQSPVTTSGTPAAVNTAIVGLVCGNTYHWALRAWNDGGGTQSADQTFTTTACGGGGTPPAVTTSPATAVGPTTATLNGAVSSNGSSTTVIFQYGLGNLATTVAATPPTLAANVSNQAVTATLTGLACASTYQYQVVGSNSAGTTYGGGGLSFTTAACGNGASTATTLTSNANPAMAGTSVTLQATVTGAAPSGTVGFHIDGIAIGGCTAVPLTGSGNIRNAFCTTAGITAPGHDVTAVYAGDAGNQASNSTPLLQTMVTGGALTCTVTANPFGVPSVTGGSLVGSMLTLNPPAATLQLGGVAGSGDYAEIDCAGLHWPAGATLAVHSGAANQMLVIKNTSSQASAIAGTIVTLGGGGAAAPALHLWNPSGIAVGVDGRVQAPSGLTLDTLSNLNGGTGLTNAGSVDGGTHLEMWSASIKGAGSYKGNEVGVHTFGTVNNPVSGAHYLGNSLQVYPSTGTDVALVLNTYGTAPQFINMKVNGNGLVWMPSAWPSNVTFPANSAPLPAGGTRPAGVGEPSYGGGSIILQTTGSMTLYRGGANDFAFPGGIALAAGATLDFNGVSLNQGWTTTGKSFQGIYLEAPAITSATPVQVWSNDLNWTNFSVQPTGHFQVSRLTAQPGGMASFVPADSEAPHLNTYSTLIDAAANLQCWTCLVNFNPISVQ